MSLGARCVLLSSVATAGGIPNDILRATPHVSGRHGVVPLQVDQANQKEPGGARATRTALLSVAACDRLKRKFKDAWLSALWWSGKKLLLGDGLRSAWSGASGLGLGGKPAYSTVRFPVENGATCEIVGHREPAQRYGLLGLDFAGKTHLDLGCNAGGMILAQAGIVKQAVGIDFDPVMVQLGKDVVMELNASAPIGSSGWSAADIDFHVMDLNEADLDTLHRYRNEYEGRPRDKYDVITMFSLTRWLRDGGKRVVEWAIPNSVAFVVEVNFDDGDDGAARRDELIELLRSRCARLDERTNATLCTDCDNRRLFVCTGSDGPSVSV